MPEVPVKLYMDKILKECRNMARPLALLSGPVKDTALRAMADRLAADEEMILAANEKDVDAVGKSFEADVMKDRMKAAVARLRMTADDIKEMVERLRMIADLPDPVGCSHLSMGTAGRIASQPCPSPDRGHWRRVRTEPSRYGGVDRALLQVGQPLCVSWRA